MEYKICYVCGLKKEIDEFPFLKSKNKYLSKCRQCKNEYERNYRSKDREKFRKINKEQYEKNREKRIEKSTNYRKNNLKKVNKKRMERYYIRIEKDKIYKLKRMVRVCICNSFYRKNYYKKENTEKLLGCDFDCFVNHLLQTFKSNYGYEWDGIEKVHIDHKKPLVTAKTEEDIIKLCNYTNLQLLKQKDNLKKGSKYSDNNLTII